MSTLGAEVHDLAREALDLRLLAVAFERPRPGWRAELLDLAAQASPDVRAIAAAAATAAEGAYHSLLGPGGAAPAREVAYVGWQDPGRLLAALSQLCDAFGFETRGEEPIDHIAVECDLAAYLLFKEAYALHRGDVEGAAAVRAARREFFATHLGVLAAGFAARLPKRAPAHLALAARALARRMPPVGMPPPACAGLPTCEDDAGVGCPFDGGYRCDARGLDGAST